MQRNLCLAVLKEETIYILLKQEKEKEKENNSNKRTKLNQREVWNSKS